ncbi:hypothetical protein JZ751_028814, partial [Albula glossodonta]
MALDIYTDLLIQTPRLPTYVFPLTTCGSGGRTDYLTLACITSGFAPASSVTFKWQDPNGRSVTDFIQYPTVERNGVYTRVSQVRVRAAAWDGRNSYKCTVRHTSLSGEKSATLEKPVPPSSPTVSLLPVCSGDSTPDALICDIRDFYPKTLALTWRVNSRRQTGSSLTWQTEKQALGKYSASSSLKVDRTKWEINELYTCEVVHRQKTFSQRTSKDMSLGKLCLEVTLKPPRVREMFINNQAVLDCDITGAEEAA